LRRSGAIKKFGTPVSEFAAAGGDAGAGRGCGDAAGFNFCGPIGHKRRASSHGAPSLHPGTPAMAAGRRDAGWRVLWLGGRGEAGGNEIGCPNLMHY
jgi:hypothetical protein